MDGATDSRTPSLSKPRRDICCAIEIAFMARHFATSFAVMNIKEVLSAPRSPWQSVYVERVIGSIRRECLDHVIILDEQGLRRVLSSYVRYYQRSRLHLSLDKDSPDPRAVQSIGEIVGIPEVGGLHHRYETAAAYQNLDCFDP
jgi:hypothetical protein